MKNILIECPIFEDGYLGDYGRALYKKLKQDKNNKVKVVISKSLVGEVDGYSNNFIRSDKFLKEVEEDILVEKGLSYLNEVDEHIKFVSTYELLAYNSISQNFNWVGEDKILFYYNTNFEIAKQIEKTGVLADVMFYMSPNDEIYKKILKGGNIETIELTEELLEETLIEGRSVYEKYPENSNVYIYFGGNSERLKEEIQELLDSQENIVLLLDIVADRYFNYEKVKKYLLEEVENANKIQFRGQFNGYYSFWRAFKSGKVKKAKIIQDEKGGIDRMELNRYSVLFLKGEENGK